MAGYRSLHWPGIVVRHEGHPVSGESPRQDAADLEPERAPLLGEALGPGVDPGDLLHDTGNTHAQPDPRPRSTTERGRAYRGDDAVTEAAVDLEPRLARYPRTRGRRQHHLVFPRSTS